MKIDYVIVSSDDNPMYLDFWPIVSKIWKKFNIKPILVLISDKDFVTKNEDCIIHEIKFIDGIDKSFQSQVCRMFITKYYQNSICMTSDIDMIPLSINYFTDSVSEYTNDKMVILSSDAYTTVRYPICYNVAMGKTFCDILEISDDCSFLDYCNRLLKFDQKWDTDELYFGLMVSKFFERERIIFLKRGWSNGATDRIDRSNWSYDINKLSSGGYIDSHLLRPYSKYKHHIDQLIKILLNE